MVGARKIRTRQPRRHRRAGARLGCAARPPSTAATLHWSARAAALGLFCLMMQGVFTMLHEFCHRNAHRNPTAELPDRLVDLDDVRDGADVVAGAALGPSPAEQNRGGARRVHPRRREPAAENGDLLRGDSRRHLAGLLSSSRSSRRCCRTRRLSGSPVTSGSTASRRASASSARATGAGCKSRDSWSLAFWGGLVWFGPWQLADAGRRLRGVRVQLVVAAVDLPRAHARARRGRARTTCVRRGSCACSS